MKKSHANRVAFFVSLYLDGKLDGKLDGNRTVTIKQ
jgi:hypothetical protein